MKKNVIIFVVVIAIIAVFYLIYRNKPKKQSSGGSSSSSNLNPSPEPGNTSAHTNDNYPLKRGVNNKTSVKFLQTLLNRNFSSGLTVDGVFGQLTENALFANTGKKEVNNAMELMRIGN